MRALVLAVLVACGHPSAPPVVANSTPAPTPDAAVPSATTVYARIVNVEPYETGSVVIVDKGSNDDVALAWGGCLLDDNDLCLVEARLIRVDRKQTWLIVDIPDAVVRDRGAHVVLRAR